jgi:hypothetical protein
LSEVQAFDAYHVYYAGFEVAGLPLEQVIKSEVRKQGKRSSNWDLIYGDCTPPPTGEGGCGLPLDIQNWSTCLRWAAAYPGKPHLFDFRGAKAAWVPTAGSLEIYTGRTTVVIFARTPFVAKSAARLMRDVNQVQAPSHLPPPFPGSLYGKLPCQGKPH